MSRPRWQAALSYGVPLALLLAALAARSFDFSRAHLVPAFDEVGYLVEAHQFAERGGPAGVVGCYLRGECRGDNRGPLYSMLLAPLMRFEDADFARGKLLTLATGGLLLLVVFGCGAAGWGADVGLAAAAIVGLTPAMAILSQEVLADVLFASLYAAAVAVLCRKHGEPRAWAVFGALVGVGYLAKGSAHFLLLAAVAVAAAKWGRAAWRRREPWLALAGFAAGAGFLLWRNVRVFGSPFHNVNDKVVWLDNWSLTWAYQLMPDRWRHVGPLWYLRHHSLLEAARRLTEGLAVVAQRLVDVFDVNPRGAAQGPLGWPLLALAVYGLWRRWKDGGRAEAAAVAAPAAALFVAYAWAYRAGAIGTRFLLPLAASMTPFAAASARELLSRSGATATLPRLVRRASVPVAVALGAALALAASGDALARDPGTFWTMPASWADAAAWLRGRDDGRGVLVSAGSSFAVWSGDRDVRRVCSYDVFDDELRAEIDAVGARLIMVDRADPGYADFPGRFGKPDAEGPTSFLGWPRVYRDPLRPSELLIFERPAPTPASSKGRGPAAPSRSAR